MTTTFTSQLENFRSYPGEQPATMAIRFLEEAGISLSAIYSGDPLYHDYSNLDLATLYFRGILTTDEFKRLLDPSPAPVEKAPALVTVSEMKAMYQAIQREADAAAELAATSKFALETSDAERKANRLNVAASYLWAALTAVEDGRMDGVQRYFADKGLPTCPACHKVYRDCSCNVA